MSRCTSTVCNANLPLMVEETAAPATTSSLLGPVPPCRQYTPGPSLHVKSKIRWLDFIVSLEVCDDAKGFMITFYSCCHYFEHSVKNKQTLLSQCMELVTHTCVRLAPFHHLSCGQSAETNSSLRRRRASTCACHVEPFKLRLEPRSMFSCWMFTLWR